MTTRKGLLVLFILANVLLGYVFPYVFLAGILSGLFMSGPAGKTAHFIGMSTMWLYVILMVLLDYILIRWLLKGKWIVWVGAALALFFAAICISSLSFAIKYSPK